MQDIEETIRPEEDHAKTMLESQLGIDFHHHDDGTKNGMPDLISANGKHVAEVITAAPHAVRIAEKSLKPISDTALPHCVRVIIPYSVIGGATKRARDNIKTDVLKLVDGKCDNHWFYPKGHFRPLDTVSAPILLLGEYVDGTKLLCIQDCRHSTKMPHQIEWSVMHEATDRDPWILLRQSLQLVDTEQHGKVQSLADKLKGYRNKHLVIYPFGPPGNMTAAFTRYVPPSNLRDFFPSQLSPPLSDVHLWLLYRYGDRGDIEGIHICTGNWTKFGTAIPRGNLDSLIRSFHYSE